MRLVFAALVCRLEQAAQGKTTFFDKNVGTNNFFKWGTNMISTLILMGASWWVGRNWDMVKQMYHDKVKPKLNNSGKATKID